MRYIAAGLVLIAFVGPVWTSAAAPKGKLLELRGQGLLVGRCSCCHAIGRGGKSPHPEAPPFRTLGQRYVIDNLTEALAEGLSTGHPDMPEFIFNVEDVGAILAYLKSIQAPGKARPRKLTPALWPCGVELRLLLVGNER